MITLERTIPHKLASLRKSKLGFFRSNGIFLFKIENLVLRARSEVIGSAIDQICSRFQVSGVSKYRILKPEH